MVQNTELLNELNKIQKDLNSTVVQLYNKYNFLSMDKSQFKSLVEAILRESVKTYIPNSDITLTKYFKRKLILTINKMIIVKIKENDDVIIKYIEFNLNYSKNNLSNLEQLKKISDFFFSIDYIPDIDFNMRILNSSKKLNKIVKSIFDDNKKKILNNINDLSIGKIGISIIEAYCVINGITELKEETMDDDFFIDNDREVEEDEIKETSFSSNDSSFFGNDSTGYFLKEIGNIPRLSDEETTRLLIEAKSGSIDARNKIIERNMKLVVSVAKKYVNRGIPLIDLIQEGTIGFITAIEKFDVNKNTKLSTYAIWWIRQSIYRSIQEKSGNIRIPVYMVDKINNYNVARRQLTLKLNREPTSQEICKELNITYDELSQLLEMEKFNTASLNTIISDDKDTEMGDLLADNSVSIESQYEKSDMQENIINLLKMRLTEKEFDIVVRRNGLLGYDVETLDNIGKEYGVTRERIRQIEAKAYRKLRSYPNINKFFVYAGYSEDDKEKMKEIRNIKKKSGLGSKSEQEIRSQTRKDMGTLYKRFYSYGYNKDQINDAILRLEQSDIDVLHQVYGRNFEKSVSNDELKKFKKIDGIFNKIKSILKENGLNNPELSNVKKEKNIYEIFSKYNKEQVDEAITRLTSEDIEVLYLRYGNDLKKPVFNKLSLKEKHRFDIIISKIKNKLRNIELSDTKKEKTIYEFFSEYTIEQVDEAITRLSSEDIEVLHLRYGKDLKNPEFNKLNTETGKNFDRAVVKIRNRLNNPELSDTKKVKTIYDYFSEYTKEQVDEAITRIPREDVEVLHLKYGKNLKNPVFNKLNKEESHKFHITILKIKYRLENPELNGAKKWKTLYDYFSEYSIEQVDEAITRLSSDDIEVLHLRYGNDLKNPEFNMLKLDEKHRFDIIISKIKNRLKNPKLSDAKKGKTIYEFLSEYTKEQVDEAITRLTNDDFEILHLRYGSDLENPIFSKLSSEENIKLKKVISKLKFRLDNPKLNNKNLGKTIYEYFSEYTKEQMDEALTRIPREDVEVLHLKYGSDLKNPVFNKLSVSDSKKFYYIVSKIKKIISLDLTQEQKIINKKIDLEEKTNVESLETGPNNEPSLNQETMSEVTKDEYIKMLTVLKTPIFKEMLKIMHPKEALIVTLTVSNNPNYSTESIANLMGINKEEVRNITIKALKLYKSQFNEFIDKVIESTTKEPLLIKEY